MSEVEFSQWFDSLLQEMQADKNATLGFNQDPLTFADARAILLEPRFANKWAHIRETALKVQSADNNPLDYISYLIHADELERPAAV